MNIKDLETFIEREFGFDRGSVSIDGNDVIEIAKTRYQFITRKLVEMDLRSNFGISLNDYKLMNSSQVVDMMAMLIDDDEEISFYHAKIKQGGVCDECRFLEVQNMCDDTHDKEQSKANELNVYFALYGGYRAFFAMQAPHFSEMERHELDLIMKAKEDEKGITRSSKKKLSL